MKSGTEDPLAGEPEPSQKSTVEFAAIAAAQKMQPGLTSFAKALLPGHKKITVEVNPNMPPMTDGRRIYINPPVELGRHRTHTRSLCNVHDDRGLPGCYACRAQEAFWRSAQHEIGHIAMGSYDPPR